MREIAKTDNCLFCNKKRDWNSEIHLISKKKDILFKVTVCKKCRKDDKISLFSLYKKVGELFKESEKDLSGNRDGKRKK